MQTKNKIIISDLKYHMIYKWMLLNDFSLNDDDQYTFVKPEDDLIISIVANDEGDNSFMIIFKENEKKMQSFTGDINLPTLLGYLLWNNLITSYKISK